MDGEVNTFQNRLLGLGDYGGEVFDFKQELRWAASIGGGGWWGVDRYGGPRRKLTALRGKWVGNFERKAWIKESHWRKLLQLNFRIGRRICKFIEIHILTPVVTKIVLIRNDKIKQNRRHDSCVEKIIFIYLCVHVGRVWQCWAEWAHAIWLV